MMGMMIVGDLEQLRERYGYASLEFELNFTPDMHPFYPASLRVIRPRFAFRTGHVTIGGSICTEMLTSQGWMPTMTMESVLLGIRTAAPLTRPPLPTASGGR